ncbi:MAG: radical SAM protein, partial [Actinobacteria bacterium]|nr:radical SAM protein [Actinomycetota bacterium]
MFDMRWDNLRLDEPSESAQDADGTGLSPARPYGELPLIERGAVARTFDTPGFRGMTFYEVHARSVVNRVPEASRMPFRWTINPYRGCQHACVYCLSGETPILMADGRTKPLAEVRAGDEVYGTSRRGRGRAYVRTTVLAHWSTVKPAYRVVLAGGTQLVCSGDHRFLTRQGWRHVTGGLLRRPHLAPGQALTGTGGFAEPPKPNAAYRRGYLCGLIRGDGSIRQYCFPPRPAADRTYLFPLPQAGPGGGEGRARAADYLARAGIGCTEFLLSEDPGPGEPCGRRRVTAIRTRGSGQVTTLEWLTGWPEDPGPDWRKGFLAGAFDACGDYRGGVLRFVPAEPEVAGWLASSLNCLSFDAAVEQAYPPGAPSGMWLRGGVRETLRFCHATDPATVARCSIE